MSVNKMTILGNTCADPKITQFQGGGKVAQFRVATKKPAFKKEDGTEVPERSDFHNIVIRGKLADVVEKYIKKGDKVYLEGELHYRKYEKDGIEREVAEIYAYTLEMLTPKPKTDNAPAPINEETPLPW